jgi:hypothetical protein
MSDVAADVSHEGNGTPATDGDLLRGIAARVSRIDRDVENLLEMRSEDRALLEEIQRDLRTYKAGIDKVADLVLMLFQKQQAAQDPMKP